jgi:hypothetical protein
MPLPVLPQQPTYFGPVPVSQKALDHQVVVALQVKFLESVFLKEGSGSLGDG